LTPRWNTDLGNWRVIGTTPEGTTIGIRAFQVQLGIMCRSPKHCDLFDEDRMSISEQCWTLRGIVCQSQKYWIVHWD